MPRPKNPDLQLYSLRLPRRLVETLDAIALAERETRDDPTLTRTDLIREALAAYVRDYERRKRGR